MVDPNDYVFRSLPEKRYLLGNWYFQYSSIMRRGEAVYPQRSCAAETVRYTVDKEHLYRFLVPFGKEKPA